MSKANSQKGTMNHGPVAHGNAIRWETKVQRKLEKTGTSEKYTVKKLAYFPFMSQEKTLCSGKLVTWEGLEKCQGRALMTRGMRLVVRSCGDVG